MIKCKECGSEISKKTDKCPSCGRAYKKPRRFLGCLLIIISIPAIILIAAYCSSTTQTATKPKKPTEKTKNSPRKVMVPSQSAKPEDRLIVAKNNMATNGHSGDKDVIPRNEPLSSNKSRLITRRGDAYTNVAIIRVYDNSTITLKHERGLMTIPISELSDDFIAANNLKPVMARIAKLDEDRQIAGEEFVKAKEGMIRQLFSAWNGSCIPLVRVTKQRMNDADSFEHVETKYIDKGQYLYVVMSFRGNNAFGAKVLNVISANVGYDGYVEVIENDE